MNKEIKPESSNPPFLKLELAMIEAAKDLAWKDYIPFVMKQIKRLQPKDSRYTLEFWQQEYPKMFK